MHVSPRIVAVVVAAGLGLGGGPASPAVADDADRVDRPRFEVLGVVFRDEVRKALVREPVLTDGTRWVEVGSKLGSYTIVTIERDRVRLEADGESFTVRLAGPPRVAGSPTARTLGTSPPSPVAKFLAWRTGASVAEIEARLRAGKGWLVVAQQYGLDRATALYEFRAWRSRQR